MQDDYDEKYDISNVSFYRTSVMLLLFYVVRTCIPTWYGETSNLCTAYPRERCANVSVLGNDVVNV